MNRFIIALAVLAACDDGTTTDTDTTDTAETGTPTDCPTGNFVGDTTVESINVNCVTTEATLQASLTGVSAVGSAVMFLQETGNIEPNWSEEHPLETESIDECLAAEELQTVIESLGVAVGQGIPGDASVFTCDAHFNDPEVLTVAVFVEDADDSSVTSCLVVGHDPQGLINGEYDNAGSAEDASFTLSDCDAA
jgi:hypothetical protein